eukprot:6509872-Karenia_brevis.AAC.1
MVKGRGENVLGQDFLSVPNYPVIIAVQYPSALIFSTPNFKAMGLTPVSSRWLSMLLKLERNGWPFPNSKNIGVFGKLGKGHK